jgi:hypothetical protein
MRKLTVADIKDHRAYEVEREELRRHVIDLKKRRRIPLGDIMTAVFENTDTMRWQVQEMARAERMLSEEQIRHEVEVYNGLVPDDGELSATLLIELTSEPALREWLAKLVGIQRSIVFQLADGSSTRGRDPEEERLTREEDMTTTVHYIKFAFTPEQAKLLREGPAHLIVDHPEYHVDVELNDVQRAELAGDLAA